VAADGATVAFTCASSNAHVEKLAAEADAAGETVAGIRADMVNLTEVAAAVEHDVAAMGGLDVLLNDAAVVHVQPIDTFREFDRLVTTNIGGVYSTIRRAMD
jgi:3-oxoacyl-[acyl-carrier protein] reductase